jgi:hypothetical protein
LKKVEVVVEFMAKIPTSNGTLETSKESLCFEGEDIEAINKSASETSSCLEPLVIKDGKKVLAVFRVWNYWREIE